MGIVIEEIKPLLNHIVTTADVYTSDNNGDIVEDVNEAGKFKEYQKVLAVGPSVKEIAVGDLVLINPSAYMVPKHIESTEDGNSIRELMGRGRDKVEMVPEFPILTIDNKDCLFLYDRDVHFVITKYRMTDDVVTDAGTLIEE